MIIASELNPARNARQRPHTPRPLPVWLQVGVVVLLLAQGVQTALHFYSSQVAQTAPASSPEKLSGFEYVYQPDHLSAVRAQADPQARYDYDPYGRATANVQPSFQYSGYYAHAPGTLSVTPMRAYAPSTGRWVERDPLPAK